MITIRMNEENVVVNAEMTLADLLVQQNQVLGHYAIAINRRFIPKANYSQTRFQEGDVIDMIAPMQGG